MDAEKPTDSTIELLTRARHGDQEALERLLSRHLKPLGRWASGRLPRGARDIVDTDDLVQDTLLQTFKRVGVFEARGVGALQAYLRQAVRNRMLDELRRKARRPEGTSLNGLESANTPSPLEEAIGWETAETYERALARLKTEDRDAIVAKVELGLNDAELADMLGKPTKDAARKAAQRALVRLAEEMRRGLA